MSQTEHERAIASALGNGGRILTLFDALGSKQNPTRGLWAAFGLARRALEGKLQDPRSVNRVLAQLRETTHATMEKNIVRAVRLGEKQAVGEVAIYDDLTWREIETEPVIENAMTALDAELDAVLAKVRSLVMLGGVDEGEILGDGARMGLLRPSEIANAATYWITTGAVLAYSNTIEAAIGERAADWNKQAIAAIDERTTDCCLRVHGQPVPLKAKFRLTGTPRYADQLEAPPFHWYCRTATSLVRAQDANDDLTRRMKDAGSAELLARERTGKRVVIHPADAFSSRAGEF